MRTQQEKGVTPRKRRQTGIVQHAMRHQCFSTLYRGINIGKEDIIKLINTIGQVFDAINIEGLNLRK
jgi:hypothetical protein